VAHSSITAEIRAKEALTMAERPTIAPHAPLEATVIDGIPTVGDGSGLATDDRYTKEEMQLALRNHGMPLEALRYPITPTGMHYMLVHFDIPFTAQTDWRLSIDGLVTNSMSLTLDDIRRRPAITIP